MSVLCHPPWRRRGVQLTLGLVLVAGQAAPESLEVRFLGRHRTGLYKQSAAEMPAYDPNTHRLFVVNGGGRRIEVLDVSDPTAPRPLEPFDVSPFGAEPTCVSTHGGVVAVSVPNDTPQLPGSVVLFDVAGRFLSRLTVGALPDMLTFTPDGRFLLVANEGEPSHYCAPSLATDPVGSVSVIELTETEQGPRPQAVRTADFSALEAAGLDPRIRISGPGASVAQDLEPEYIAVSSDSRTAYVALQENNAIAVVDIAQAEVVRLLPLGYKDHASAGLGLDPSDRDDVIRIGAWPVRGLYQPDAIASHDLGGRSYILTANEGDVRDHYECFTDQARVMELRLDPEAFPTPGLQEQGRLGRLFVSRTDGDEDGDGDLDSLYSFGARSFSIWTTDGQLVFDSGQEFEEVLARELPEAFNADSASAGSRDTRSDDRGPEPEGIDVGQVGDRTYAFIGLERPSGVMVYDITNPGASEFVTYVHPGGVAPGPSAELDRDVGPEGVLFIPLAESPGAQALLVVANEISGTVALYAVAPPAPSR